MRMNLRTYWSLIFAAFIILFALLLSIGITQLATDELKNEKGNTLSSTAFQMSDKLDRYMWSRYSEVNIVSNLNTIDMARTSSETQQLLDEFTDTISAFSWVGITNTEGIVQASSDGILEGEDISELSLFKGALDGAFIGDVHGTLLLSNLLPNPTGEPMKFVDISTPLYNENNEFTGVFATHLSWKWAEEVQNSILNSLSNEANDQVEVFVISSEGNTVLLGPEDMIGESISLESVEQARTGKHGYMLETWPDGENYLTGYSFGAGYQDYPGLKWIVLVRQPESAAFASALELRQFILIAGGISAIIFALGGWIIAGRISKPLHQISKTAQRLRSGENLEIPKYKGIKDIEELSSSLQDLITTLGKTESNLIKMKGIAYHDHLTGLANRIALELYTGRYIEAAKKNNETLTFLYLDLDGFKKVNDTLGHRTGDLLLQKVANRLNTIADSDSFVSRIGGDEFILLVPSSEGGPMDNAKNIADLIVASLNEPFIIEGTPVQIGCSVGAAVYPKDDKDPYTLISYADQALYVSKENGKNQVTFYQKQAK
ncbi:sensor domain-containing diguanylate cyclase [Jeotgalibacillus soli]|uniref:Diguanylate cyclase n=1 Tax=Jeotgalibacillus soli TaxID=889306 RepID=A0A0C2RGY4_9BACL|nr:sensor domain-containing diguanylate cyclase [Jeotgalibacillus soli]KIL49430.1 hypothetical protein KP78_08980 [Jeotgalibacillus soli]